MFFGMVFLPILVDFESQNGTPGKKYFHHFWSCFRFLFLKNVLFSFLFDFWPVLDTKSTKNVEKTEVDRTPDQKKSKRSGEAGFLGGTRGPRQGGILGGYGQAGSNTPLPIAGMGGRIEPAEPEPPPAHSLGRVGEDDMGRSGKLARPCWLGAGGEALVVRNWWRG